MKTPHNRKGIMLAWVAVVTLLLVGAVGFACDYAYVFLVQQKLQTVADGASLAGARFVTSSTASAVNTLTHNVAAKNTVAGVAVQLMPNPGNALGGDIVIGQWNATTRQFTPTLTSPNAVQVLARFNGSSPNGPVGLLFGPIFGVHTVGVQRTAIALANAGAGGNAGLIVLAPTGSSALSMTGNGNLTILNGDVQVDSSDKSALRMSGGGNIKANYVDLVGGYSFSGKGGVTGNIETGSPNVPDPLANVPAPQKGADLGKVSLSGKQNATINPGYYSGGITNSGSGSLTLNPGVYIVDGAGINISGDGAFTANGVMFYVTGKGTINLSGNGAVSVTPPDPAVNDFPGAATYQGISIFQDRSNANSMKITGDSAMNLDGVIYLPNTDLTLSGNGGTMGAQLIVNTLKLTGNGSVTINRSNGHVHPSPVSVCLVQ